LIVDVVEAGGKAGEARVLVNAQADSKIKSFKSRMNHGRLKGSAGDLQRVQRNQRIIKKPNRESKHCSQSISCLQRQDARRDARGFQH